MSEWEHILSAGVLVLFRLSGLFVFAPIFSSPAIASRIKVGFAFAMAILVAPGIAVASGAVAELGVSNILGELAVGLLFGVSLMMLTEAVMFAGTLLGMQFSFSLVNLIDPVSKVETPVLGQMLSWMTTLILLGAGLHRTLIAAVLRSFDVIPVGTFAMSAASGAKLAHMASGTFLAGVQLASPVMAAALLVEITIALMGRISPQLPTTILSVPVKTIVSYGVLMGSLAIWPGFLERHFDSLLSAAAGLLGQG
ncbi:MAG: flagellar biosynthetic protein FliR [Acidobacteriaceae bacterium]|nr:flagellar biosynthetic protein FliR [Acidobacteriaceae bacterium]